MILSVSELLPWKNLLQMLKSNLMTCLHNLLLSKQRTKMSWKKNKSVEDKLTFANEKVANLKKIVARLEGELCDKDKAQFDLISNLDEVKKLIITNHREGFQKAQLQVVVFLPYFDYKRHDMSYDVVDSEIIR